MATLQETVQAVLAELQKQGTNLQNTEIASSGDDISLLLAFKSDGSFIRLSPDVLRDANTKYVTAAEYEALKQNNELQDNVEYNIYEDE